MIGPFKPALGNFKFDFVLIDKFSKWIEYMPLVKATFEKAVEFLNQIIHSFGVPNSIITDLGTQFTGTTFWDFCDDRGIVIKYVSVAHPRANGQVERANGMIIDTLKKRLYIENDRAPGRWMKELSAVVWGLRTQTSRNTGVSPYFIVYGTEAVLPSDVVFGSLRVEHFDQSSTDLTRELEINCTEEKRLILCLRTAKYLEAIRRYHNRNVKDRSFMVGDLVLK
jgi:transposase InsO family protein